MPHSHEPVPPVPVVSYSRTSLSRSLSTNPTLDPLKSLSLSFSLKSPVSASQEGSASLLDQALSTPLPFFLVSLVSEALTLFAKKAVKFLPLVFNPISIDVGFVSFREPEAEPWPLTPVIFPSRRQRLSNDLASHASIAASLANILLRQPTQDSSTQTAASLKLFVRPHPLTFCRTAPTSRNFPLPRSNSKTTSVLRMPHLLLLLQPFPRKTTPKLS